jgi:ethanolamine utilization protein EutN
MFLGRVTGTVWSTVKWPEAKGLKLLLVRPYRLGDLAPGTLRPGVEASEPTDDLVVCADTLDAGPGDDVLVAFGHAARVALSEKLPPGGKPNVPIDAAVVAVVDRVEIDRVDGAGLRPAESVAGGSEPSQGSEVD